MAKKLYGEGHIIQLGPKHYRVELSTGAKPGTGIIVSPRRKDIPDGALACIRRDKAELARDKRLSEYMMVSPRVKYADVDDSERARYYWKIPAEYGKVVDTVHGTKGDAKRRLEEMRAHAEGGARTDTSKITYAKVSDNMLKGIELRGQNVRTGKPLTRKTIMDYRNVERHIIMRDIGSMRMQDIDRATVLETIDSMYSDGLGEHTIVKCVSQMNRVFERARRDRIITFNPMDDIDRHEKPTTPKTTRKPLPEDSMLRLVSTVLESEPTGHLLVVLLGACNGLRLGEALGLTWSRVHLDADIPYLEIEQQHTDADGLHSTKTSEEHVTPLDRLTVDYLRRWRDIQEGQLRLLGVGIENDTPVCMSKIGTHIGTTNFETWWRGWCVDNGFGKWLADDGREIAELTIGQSPDGYEDCIIEWRDASGWPCDEFGNKYSRTNKRPPREKRHYCGLKFHEMRHTYFTRRAEDGVPIKDLQVMGGWSSTRMLMEIYAHAEKRHVLQQGGYMDRMFGYER